MNRKATMLLRGVLAALMASAMFAASASAEPEWHFDGKALEGTETVVGGAEDSYMTVPGLVTDCENFLYDIAIANNAKTETGEGELEELPLFDCGTDSEFCTVDAVEAVGLPWSTELETQGSDDYIVINGILVEVLYGGEECVLNEWIVPVEGSAGGLIDNGTESATFDSESFEATETELTALFQPIEWNGFFPTEAFKWHREEALTVE